MQEKIIIDALTDLGVSVARQQYAVADGQPYAITLPYSRCAYANSDQGRAAIAIALPEPYLSAVMAVWDDIPTIVESQE
jgi:hypothetical protein